MSVKKQSARMVLSQGLRIVGRFIRARPWSFASAVTGAALFAGSIIASSAVIGWITDTAILPVLQDGEPTHGRLTGVVAAIAAVAAWKAAAIVMRRTSAGWLQLRTRQDLRSQLIGTQMDLELAWFDRQSIGNLLSVADTDAEQGTSVLAPLPYATGVSLLVVGTVVLLALLDPWLGLVALVGMTLVVAIEVRSATVLYPFWERIQVQHGVVSGLAHEMFDGALTLKALGREPMATQRMKTESDELRERLVYVGVRWETYRTIIVSLIPAISLITLAVGAARVDAGAISAGDVVTALYLLSLLTFPIQLIAFVLFDLAVAIPAWNRVAAVMTADEVVKHGAVVADESGTPAPVESSTVGFSYEEGVQVLDGLDIDIPAGRTVAIVGRTGSGKTTLALLLARLWDPKSGSIRIDGRDLRDFARFELPKEVAFVAQEAFLFDDTVRGNISLGLDVGESEIDAATALAGASEFVTDLPRGLDTPIGERGASLSGGQRQRLALARALVRKPRLLILDDATSAVDPSVERAILERLREASMPSTVVIVAYRPSSIRLADEVVFVSAGRVVDQGTHAELMARQPTYADLVQAYERDAALRSRDDG
ncbi:MAG: ABC transporter ATP-binding protein [Acidimicrobiia bacterium]|nr:ABC transporter ATP-binding protein/permease [Acidimicrobiia bacterium]NNF64840.1 ABC transporter ATP-binding protein [Acidimicrobiia bacterium]